MSVLVDTNVLLRRTQPNHPSHAVAVESVARFLAAGEQPVIPAPSIARAVRKLFAQASRVGMIPPQEKTMPPRKSLDIDADLAALQARADKLRADQKLMLGELVLETGVHKLLDADQIREPV